MNPSFFPPPHLRRGKILYCLSVTKLREDRNILSLDEIRDSGKLYGMIDSSCVASCYKL